MSTATDTPGALWYWATDQGNWHAYPAALLKGLEDAFANKVTRFPVDADRFVDAVKMEQRRFDMTGKPRKVKREVQAVLKAFTFAIVGNLAVDVVAPILHNGGIATTFLTEKVTHIVCDEPQLNLADINEALDWGKPVIKSTAIAILISNGVKTDLSLHTFSKKDLSPHLRSIPSSIAPAPPLQSLHQDVFLAAPEPWHNAYSRPLDAHTEWLGALRLPDGSVRPASLDITHFQPNGELIGAIKLPGLNSGTSIQVSGVLDRGGGHVTEAGEKAHTLILRIRHYLTNSIPNVPENTVFKGHLDQHSNSIKLTFKQFTFTFGYSRHVPEKPFPFLQPGTSWSGTATSDVAPFALQISKNDGNNIEGTVTWTDLDAKTSLLGHVLPFGQITFSETGVISQPEGEELDMQKAHFTCLPRFSLSSTSAPSYTGTWQANEGTNVSSGKVELILDA